ncbi:MAG TPA: hypothetical protein VNK04_00090 [Gemmataceae bacterium]|nr:hypothetical protein [Gemmataceae bacterium]
MGGRARRLRAEGGGKGRSARHIALVLLALVLCPRSFLLPSAVAQTPGGDGTYYSSRPEFRIPFQTDPNERRIQQVELYVSRDLGRSWQRVAAAPPAERSFRFLAQQDGWYYFAVRTIDFQGQGYPPTPDQFQAGLRVCVDTLRPTVVLRAVTPPEGGVGVEWQITDENLDLDSLRLEQRVPGNGDWTPLAPPRAAAARHSWNPGTNAPLEVRLQVRDRAGNIGEQTVTVTPSVGPGAAATAPSRPLAAPGPGAVRRVNSKRISLNYKLEDVGKSGVAVIELWYTRDPQARNWQKHNEQTNPQPPYVVEVSEEGLYGFTLVARSGVGFGEQPPRVGDPPQVWVEVDLTKPRVQLLNLEVGRGPEMGNLTITWSATDKNLGPRPITLAYAERPEGPWTVIAANEENSGRFLWRMPPDVPYQFYVRVEATDLAGNVGSAETAKPIVVDLSQPKVRVLGVDPADKP